MKKLCIYLFLVLFSLQAPSWAEDIRDFQIEGISLGDSLLDYFSEKEIKKNTLKTNYKDKTYNTAQFNFLSSFETCDALHIFIKRNNTKFIIYSISAMLDFSNDIKGCKEKKDGVVAELSKLFNGAEVYSDKDDHDQDTSGESKIFRTSFFINPKNEYPGVKVACYDWSDKMGYRDQLRVSIATKEFSTWLNTKAYD